jgi:hypothetical protein
MRDARILVVLKIFSNRLFSGVQRTHRVVVSHHVGELYIFADADGIGRAARWRAAGEHRNGRVVLQFLP